MSCITVNNNQLVVSAEDKILLCDTKNNNKVTEIQIPAIDVPSNLSKNQQEAMKNEKSTVLTSTFSKCGNYFAICLLNKQLVIYDSTFNVVKNLTVPRTASKIRFTPSNDIVLADKTGDVYLYKLKSDTCEPTQLLGHLSMLLDVLLSDCGKYIVTCDRDEKIRVSRFPDSYNIESFCLGHDEFVLNVEFLNSEVLVSSSGDGTIRFWNYLTGSPLKVINTNDHVQDKEIIQKFSEFMDSETVEVNSLPVTSMKLQKFENFAVIIVSLYSFSGLQVYKVTENIDVDLLQVIEVNKLVSFDISDKLYVLTDYDIQVYEFNNSLFHLSRNTKLDDFYNSCKDVIKKISSENISVLYKRKYDNVQEYQERKKLRIESLKK